MITKLVSLVLLSLLLSLLLSSLLLVSLCSWLFGCDDGGGDDDDDGGCGCDEYGFHGGSGYRGECGFHGGNGYHGECGFHDDGGDDACACDGDDASCGDASSFHGASSCPRRHLQSHLQSHLHRNLIHRHQNPHLHLRRQKPRHRRHLQE
jgi:hypothetical protein